MKVVVALERRVEQGDWPTLVSSTFGAFQRVQRWGEGGKRETVEPNQESYDNICFDGDCVSADETTVLRHRQNLQPPYQASLTNQGIRITMILGHLIEPQLG